MPMSLHFVAKAVKSELGKKKKPAGGSLLFPQFKKYDLHLLSSNVNPVHTCYAHMFTQAKGRKA